MTEATATPSAQPKVFNVNVGILGHVDSGKTSLVAALSEVLSVAALDKHPQSQARGITLDLGLSSFQLPCPDDLRTQLDCDVLQFALIDCPGHASLIKTVLVGAQIMDLMVLVIDVTKGIQAQTAECIILGELLSSSMVVVLNKTDLLPADKRRKLTRRAGRAVLDALRLTRFADSEVVPLSAKGPADGTDTGRIADLKAALLRNLPAIARDADQPFLFMADHCFTVKGHGTVLSGNVLQGSVKVGDQVEVPVANAVRKVKSLQSFKVQKARAAAGDRIGLCLTKLPADRLERTYVTSPGLLSQVTACICSVDRCRFFQGKLQSRKKVLITVGYQTTMAHAIFFGLPSQRCGTQDDLVATMFERVGKFACKSEPFNLRQEYLYQEELYGITGRPPSPRRQSQGPDYGQEWVLLTLDRPVLAVKGSVIISAHFDVHSEQKSQPSCRIAFYGNIVHIFPDASGTASLRLYKDKYREGRILRAEDDRRVIVQGMFKKESNLDTFVGKEVTSASGCRGVLRGSFGTSAAKVRVEFASPLPPQDREQPVMLQFKKYLLQGR